MWQCACMRTQPFPHSHVDVRMRMHMCKHTFSHSKNDSCCVFTNLMTKYVHCCLHSSKPGAEQSLVSWARPQLHDFDALAQMVDPALRGAPPPKQQKQSLFLDLLMLLHSVFR